MRAKPFTLCANGYSRMANLSIMSLYPGDTSDSAVPEPIVLNCYRT